jgi:hypothetical protein
VTAESKKLARANKEFQETIEAAKVVIHSRHSNIKPWLEAVDKIRKLIVEQVGVRDGKKADQLNQFRTCLEYPANTLIAQHGETDQLKAKVKARKLRKRHEGFSAERQELVERLNEEIVQKNPGIQPSAIAAKIYAHQDTKRLQQRQRSVGYKKDFGIDGIRRRLAGLQKQP